MEAGNQSHCELGEENLDFLLGIVDYCGVGDDNNNINNNNGNDILMSMDEEGDDDVFENVLIHNSSNFCPNTSNKPHVCDSHNHLFPLSSLASNNNMGNNLLIPNNENKENSDTHLSVDRNNNSNCNSSNSSVNNLYTNNTFVTNNNQNMGSNGSINSTCTFNDGDITNSSKVYHNLQSSRVVPMATTSNNGNNNNNGISNDDINWSNFGDFNLPDSSFLFPNNTGSNCGGSQNNNNFSTGSNADDKSIARSFHWYERNGDNGGTSCSSISRTASSSSSMGSSNGSTCGSIGNGGNCCGSNCGTSGSSIHDTSGSSSSRNSSCSSYSGAFVSTNTTTSTHTASYSNSDNNSSSSLSNNGGSTCSGSSSSNSNNNNSKELIVSAYMEACRSGQLTPILKEELKFFIQARRLSQGKEEMEVQFTPPSPSQLSVKEKEKIERRKKQNRQAAKRFRQKQKSCEDVLLQKIKDLEGVNTSLFEEAQVLREEKQKLMEVIAEHLRVCPFFSLKSPILPEGEWSAGD